MTQDVGPKKTLYLVDGTSQLFRAYFAIRGLTNPEGKPTNAVFGFTAMLRKLLAEEKPEHLAVAFDLPGPTFRHDRYADYKANRPPTPEDLDVQVPWAKEVCHGYRIPVLEEPGYEADDLIGTYARLAREAGYEVVVVASDKDLLQLVGEGVTVLNPSKNLLLDATGVAEHFGVPPDRVRDVLGLMGDAVDNIPGVPGVGEKTALAMVSAYGPVEAVVERAARFTEVFEARDALLAALETAEGDAAPAEAVDRFRRAVDALLEVEVDPAFRGKLRAALDRSALAGSRELKRLLKDLEKGTNRKVWTALHAHADRALLSRDLATLEREAPAAFAPEQFVVGVPDTEKLAELFRALNFRRLLEEFTPAGPAPEGGPASGGSPEGVAASARAAYRTILERAELESVAQCCREAGRFAADTETDGTDPMRARLVGISLSWAEGQGAYVPVGHRYLGAPEQLPLQEVRRVLAPLLADPTVGKVGQNLKYDHHVLRRHGMPVEGWILDTMVAAFLLNPDRVGFKMDSLAQEYLGYTPIPYEALAGRGAKRITLDQVEVDRVAEYAAEDADVTLRLAGVLEPRLESSGLSPLYREIDGPLLPVLAEMEAAGIRVDADRLRAMSVEMEQALDAARSEIHRLAGTEFNVDSPKQLREVLFERLGLSPRRKTAKSGVHSTDAQTLEELSDEHEIARRLLEYRELAKLKGTYVDALPALVHPETGRIHTSYHPTGAATGRLSSSDPNLQNIPARTDAGLAIRSAFVPEPGWVFLASDYSQVELRVLAHLCGDPELVAAFRAREDIHRRTASRVFGVEPDEVTDAMRRRAKAVNFGILYGMSETRLARDQGISRAEARGFIKAYFERFAGVRAYIERIREEATRDGAVRTLFGRVRWFPSLHGKGSRADVEQALRAAVNTTIQGTAADLMKLAMLRVRDTLAGGGLRARMLLQVHDELLLEVPEDELESARERVRAAMEEVHRLEVPLLVDQKTGADWRDVT
jgi:DNA polymerase I